MKLSFTFTRSVASLLAVAASLVMLDQAKAASLSLNPNVISNQYAGRITLQVGGLTNGEPVILATYTDFNANGTNDANDLLVQSFVVTNGQASVIGGITNINVPWDSNTATNAITTEMNYAQSNFRPFAGSYVCRVSSPTGRFTPVTAALSITNGGFSQTFTGAIRSNGTNVPNAFIAVLSPSEHEADLVAGTISDAAGNYTVKVAPGSYMLVAVKSGYVSDFATAPFLTIGTNATINTNLFLIAATRTISGRIVNAANTNTVIPGVRLAVESTNELFALAFSDANGNFSIPVTASVWNLGLQEDSIPSLSYMTLEEDAIPSVNTMSGNVTNFDIPLTKVDALIYGYLRDGDLNPIPGVSVEAYGQESFTHAVTATNGYYVLGVFGTNWQMGASSHDLEDLGYGGNVQTNATVSTGQAVRADLNVPPVTARLIGQAVDSGGNPLGNIGLFVGRMSGGGTSSSTDGNGNFNIGLSAGTWNLQLESQDARDRGLVGPSLQFTLGDGTNITGINLVAQNATFQISGFVRQTNSAPITFVNVSASATVNGTNYSSFGETDGGGNYSIGVFNGNWSVNVSGDDLSDLGFETPPGTNVTVSGSNRTVNFTIYPSQPLQITTTSLPSGQEGQWYSANVNASGGRQPYHWTVISNSLPPGLMMEQWGYISGTPTAAGTFNFTVQVNDNDDNNVTKGLSITIGNASAHLSGRAVNSAGSPLANISIFANGQTGGNSYAQTDTNGNFNVGVSAGTWYLQMSGQDAQNLGVVSPNLEFTVGDGTNITGINLVAQLITAQISGFVRQTNSNPVTNINVFANTIVNGTNYNAGSQTDASGNYSFGVINGSWNVGVSSYDLYQRGFDTPENQTIVVNGSNRTADFTVYPVGPLQITTTNLPSGLVSQNYHTNLQATGGQQPYNWSIVSGSLPPGVNFYSGLIQGFPTNSGTFNFTVQVTDQQTNTVSRNLSITIYALQIMTPSLPNGTLNQFYSTNLTAEGGTQPYYWSTTGPLPPGISLSSNGNISGNPTSLGTYNFTVTLNDSGGNTTNKSLSITIGSASLQITTASLPNGTVNQFYSTSFSATGGTPPYYWSTTGPLPPGISLSSNGNISGTPTNSGTYNFTVSMNDSGSGATNKSFSLTIDAAAPPPSFISFGRNANGNFEMLIQGVVGRSYRFDGSTTLTPGGWTQLQTSSANPGDGRVYFQDTSSPSFNYRFYRAVLLP